jgi:zinc transporter ZupT
MQSIPLHDRLTVLEQILQDQPVHLTHTPDDMPTEAAKAIDTYVTNDHHRFGLQKMGILTALAIGIHNLPEGLATFIAALADPLNGVAIAVAIALHNIPEGVCVAMPVYYATGSRWKGFWWAFLSGASEPIGGILGYAVLYGNRMSDIAYGLLFCVVGGMMVRTLSVLVT